MNQKEFRLACACADDFKRVYPKYVELFTHFPAGEKRSRVTGARLKRQGLGKGWPDYQLMLPRHGLHALFIELKVDSNNPGADQRERIRALRGEGYGVALVYSYDEFFQAVEDYMTGNLGNLFHRITRTTHDEPALDNLLKK